MNFYHFSIVHADKCCAITARLFISFGFMIFLATLGELPMGKTLFAVCMAGFLFSSLLALKELIFTTMLMLRDCDCGHDLRNLDLSRIEDHPAFVERCWPLLRRPRPAFLVLSVCLMMALLPIYHAPMLIVGVILILLGLQVEIAHASGSAKTFEAEIQSRC